MRTFRIIGFAAICTLACACAKQTVDPLPEPVAVQAGNMEFRAESMFYQGQYVTDALSLTPQGADGRLEFGFSTDYSSVNYRYPAPEVRVSRPNQAVSTEAVPGGQTETSFHFEIPMTLEALLPEVFLEVESLWMDAFFFFSLTLSPDFPFTQAQFVTATITFPSWADSEHYSPIQNHQLTWANSTVKSAQVLTFQPQCRKVYALQEGEGLRKEDHVLTLDNTVIIDGTIRVNEADRKDPAEKGTPWTASFLTGWKVNGGTVSNLTGKMDLSRALPDRSVTFSSVPDFFKWPGLSFDLDDLYGEVTVKNEIPLPVSLSGVMRGDEREYSFGAENGRTPVWVPVGKGEYHVLLSEKGGRVNDDGFTDRIDLPTPGFSGLIDGDPVSFALKDLRVKNDPDQSFRFIFDQDNQVLLKGRISSPMMIGKDFRFRTGGILAEIPASKNGIRKMTGSFRVSNSLPFDFDVLPVIYDREFTRLPVRMETVHIPAGKRDAPTEVPVDLAWESPTPVPAGYLFLELTARTGEGREGVFLYKDQRIAFVNDPFLVY